MIIIKGSSLHKITYISLQKNFHAPVCNFVDLAQTIQEFKISPHAQQRKCPIPSASTSTVPCTEAKHTATRSSGSKPSTTALLSPTSARTQASTMSPTSKARTLATTSWFSQGTSTRCTWCPSFVGRRVTYVARRSTTRRSSVASLNSLGLSDERSDGLTL